MDESFDSADLLLYSLYHERAAYVNSPTPRRQNTLCYERVFFTIDYLLLLIFVVDNFTFDRLFFVVGFLIAVF